MDALDLILRFAGGLVAGAAYYLALWLMVRWFTRRSAAPAWLLLGAAVRLALLMGALFWIMGGRPEGLAAALAGFFVVRLAALRWGRSAVHAPPSVGASPRVPESRDAADA